MELKLTDEQAAALVRELNNIVQNDRYPLSPRIVTLKEILGLLRPEPERAAVVEPPPRIWERASAGFRAVGGGAKEVPVRRLEKSAQTFDPEWALFHSVGRKSEQNQCEQLDS